jgi:hypothetical protein
VFVVCKLPQVVDRDRNQAHLAGPTCNPVIQGSTKEAGKNRENVGLHRETVDFSPQGESIHGPYPSVILSALCG